MNGTVIGGLQSPPSGWFEAIVQGAVYLAALKSKGHDLAFQQLAVSHAAHDALTWTFHGTRLYATIDQKIKAVLAPIGVNATSPAGLEAASIGREAARVAITRRADDGINYFVDWTNLTAVPGAYQATPGGQPVPDTPQAQTIRPFGGIGDIRQWRAPPPPSATGPDYEKYVLEVKTLGARNGSTRTQYQTETAYYWRESSPIYWNRLATAVIGNSLSKDVVKSAKFYAQLNYALANAAIASWDSK